MRKAKKVSIFRKTVTMNLTIIVVAFLVVTIFSLQFVGSYISERNKMLLWDNTTEICELTKNLSQYPSNSEIVYIYNLSLNMISRSTKSTIFIVLPDNTLFYRTQYNDIAIDVDRISENKEVQKVLNGKEITSVGLMDKLLSPSAYTVGKPVIIDDKVVAAVFMTIPVPHLDVMKYNIMGIMIFTAIGGVLIALLVSYFLTKRLVKPIAEVNVAAREIAGGNLQERVSSDDVHFIEVEEMIDSFNEMTDVLARAENSRKNFVAGISHELRTPMTSIIGFLQAISDGVIPPEKQGDYIKMTLIETKRMNRLINQLLDVSRYEDSDKPFEMETFDIIEVIRLQLLKFETDITNKNIDVNLEIFKEKCYCVGNFDAITRVIINLFENAVKFTNENGYINVKVIAQDKKAIISVENSGLGMSEDDMAHVFEKFYKTDKSRSLDKQGLGLGLYLVKDILIKHNEKIWVESEEGKFTKFVFSLKLVDADKKPL